MNLIPVRWAAKSAHLLVLSTLLSLSLLAQAPPSADTFTVSSSPRSNYGAWPLLVVQPGSNTYLQFNLSHLPANSTVTKATLRLFVNAVSRAGSFDVYQLNHAWTEGGLSYSNAPALGSSGTGGNSIAITNSSLNQFLIIDLTPLVQQWVSGALPNNGVALALTTSNGAFSFDSKEAILTSHQPELIVTLAGEAGPQGQPGPQGPQGETGQQGPAGPTGANGAQGPAGPAGQPGAQGPQGPAGNNGTNGVSFTFRNAFDPNQSYAVNDVVTFNGSSYIAIAPTQGQNNPTPDQSPSAWTLMAQAGSQGPTGPQGPQGAPGPQGPIGAIGPAGPIGPAGATGPQGAQGATGAQGPQGPVGATGPTGPPGERGPQGPQGISGLHDAGPWNSGTLYNPGDVVLTLGNFGGYYEASGVYIAAESSVGVTPGTDGAWVGSPFWGYNQPTTQVSGTPAVTCYLGEIRLFPFQVQNGQWVVADGRLLPISSNQLLFSLLGTNFGGDGRQTFGIPDYRPSSLNGSLYHICVGYSAYP